MVVLARPAPPPVATPDQVADAATAVVRAALGAADREMTPAETWTTSLADLIAFDEASGLPARSGAEVARLYRDARRVVTANRRVIELVARRFAHEDSAAGVSR